MAVSTTVCKTLGSFSIRQSLASLSPLWLLEVIRSFSINILILKCTIAPLRSDDNISSTENTQAVYGGGLYRLKCLFYNKWERSIFFTHPLVCKKTLLLWWSGLLNISLHLRYQALPAVMFSYIPTDNWSVNSVCSSVLFPFLLITFKYFNNLSFISHGGWHTPSSSSFTNLWWNLCNLFPHLKIISLDLSS